MVSVERTYIADETQMAQVAAGALLLAAILFNAVLALINAQLMPLSSAIVVACEILIVGAAHMVALLYFRVRMAPWYALIVVLAGFALFRGAAVGGLDVKYLRDAVLIPTFLVLGMTYPRHRLPQLLVALQFVVLGVMAMEAFAPDAYAQLFDIKSYYINTRGYVEGDFWNTGSNLYVSASRPEERFFAFADFHRMSSVFLEPVSLGNYCIIIAAYVFASWRMLSGSQRLILLGGTALLIVGCDGRLAAISCLIIFAASLVAARLPPYSTILVAPVALAVAMAAVTLLGLQAGADDFAGRLAHTVQLLRSYGLAEFLGVSNLYLSKAVDSGLAYLITTQSIIVTALIWLVITLMTEERNRQEAVFKMSVALYLSLSMLVSFSFLSIKTAALLWFILGAMQPGYATLPTLLARSRGHDFRATGKRQERHG